MQAGARDACRGTRFPCLPVYAGSWWGSQARALAVRECSRQATPDASASTPSSELLIHLHLTDERRGVPRRLITLKMYGPVVRAVV